MFHATRKRGPRKYVTGFIMILSWCHACKNEVIIERYHSFIVKMFSWVATGNPRNFFTATHFQRKGFQTMVNGSVSNMA